MSGMACPPAGRAGLGRERRHRPPGKLGEGSLWLRLPVSPGQRARAWTFRYPTQFLPSPATTSQGARTPSVRPSGPGIPPGAQAQSPAAGWADKPQRGLRLAAKACESQDAGTGHASSWRPAPRSPWLGRSIWISRYGLNCDGRMARSASDATGPVESVSEVLDSLRQARAGDRGESWNAASGSG